MLFGCGEDAFFEPSHLNVSRRGHQAAKARREGKKGQEQEQDNIKKMFLYIYCVYYIYYIILYYIILYYIILYYILYIYMYIYRIIWCYIVLYYSILCYIVLYYSILYYIFIIIIIVIIIIISISIIYVHYIYMYIYRYIYIYIVHVRVYTYALKYIENYWDSWKIDYKRHYIWHMRHCTSQQEMCNALLEPYLFVNSCSSWCACLLRARHRWQDKSVSHSNQYWLHAKRHRILYRPQCHCVR